LLRASFRLHLTVSPLRFATFTSMRLGRDFHPLAAEYAGQKNSAPTLGTSLQVALSLPLRNSLKRGTRLYCVAHSICRSSDHRVPRDSPSGAGAIPPLSFKANRLGSSVKDEGQSLPPTRLLSMPVALWSTAREALLTASHRNAVGSRTNSMRRTSLPQLQDG
jgi:hypothetical protein